jgi:hypothetical protein
MRFLDRLIEAIRNQGGDRRSRSVRRQAKRNAGRKRVDGNYFGGVSKESKTAKELRITRAAFGKGDL